MSMNEMPKLTIELNAEECVILLEVLKNTIKEFKESINEVENLNDLQKLLMANRLIDLREKIGNQSKKGLGKSTVEMN